MRIVALCTLNAGLVCKSSSILCILYHSQDVACVKVAVAESLISDLDRDSEWCDLWGMKLNASKTKTASKTIPSHPH